jgi:hypothetical protein
MITTLDVSLIGQAFNDLQDVSPQIEVRYLASPS